MFTDLLDTYLAAQREVQEFTDALDRAIASGDTGWIRNAKVDLSHVEGELKYARDELNDFVAKA